MIVTQATPQDLPALLQLYEAVTQTMSHQGIDQWDAIYPSAALLQADVESGTMYIGQLSETLACAFVLNTSCEDVYTTGAWKYPNLPFLVLHRLCVHPQLQGQGLAQTAMQEVMRLLKEQNSQALRLDVFSQNPYALRLYQGLGFQEVGHVHFRKGLFYLMETYL